MTRVTPVLGYWEERVMKAEAEVVRLKADNAQVRALLQGVSATRDTAVNMKLEREAEIERLTTERAVWKTACSAQANEVERLRATLKSGTVCIAERDAEIEQLTAALKPFALNVNAVSLRDALGHISREDLLRARAALEPKP